MMINATARLHEKIVAAGIPLKSVRVEKGVPQLVFLPEATAQQREQAIAMLADLDLHGSATRRLADREALAAFMAKTPADGAERALQAMIRLSGMA